MVDEAHCLLFLDEYKFAAGHSCTVLWDEFFYILGPNSHDWAVQRSSSAGHK